MPPASGGAVASVVRAKGACVEGLLYELDNVDLRELDRFEGHPFAYERVIRWVRDESGRRRRVMTYLQPEDGFEAWTPPLGYFTVLWHAYARLGFDVEPLARAAGVSP
ncbi:MAG: gamma-glutamylcyclotransferase [Nevskiales bacterium]|nr:gamma-glutamylcyclotransferase [Nevskiales bacterium]